MEGGSLGDVYKCQLKSGSGTMEVRKSLTLYPPNFASHVLEGCGKGFSIQIYAGRGGTR